MFTNDSPPWRIWARVLKLNWFILLLLMGLASIGVLMLYSAAGMQTQPWASAHLQRFALSLCVLLLTALIDIRIWYNWAYAIFFTSVVMLGLVEFIGSGSGSQRWISLFGFTIQPSEFVKVTLILALARYFGAVGYNRGTFFRQLLYLSVPVLSVACVAFLIAKQPDLGTAVMLLLLAAAVFWIAGVHWGWFVAGASSAALSAILAWHYLLYDYQKHRLLVFLNPGSDPLGQGYHILQSKIALGSGGLSGKGWGQGSQSGLDFLPEKHTDFIFTMLAEEFGFLGTMGILSLYGLLIGYGLFLASRQQWQFTRLLMSGVTILMALFVVINTAMVSGLLPVVGVPLPFVSHGGNVMLALAGGYGLFLSANMHSDKNKS